MTEYVRILENPHCGGVEEKDRERGGFISPSVPTQAMHFGITGNTLLCATTVPGS
jgi:hypothetical protein